MATLFAARLARAGITVSMLGAWPGGLKALRDNGARLVDSAGHEQSFSVFATSDPRACQGARHALVLVKSWQTDRVAHQLADCLADDGLVVTLQNGLGNRETLAASVGEARVVLGSTTTGATRLGPGLVKAGGEGIISLEHHEGLGPLKEALESAGFRVELIKDARSLLWNKLLISSAINPLTALLRISNGQLLERPTARALLHALAEETAAVALAEKATLSPGAPAAIVEDIALRTAANHSSMFQDIQRGAPTEIDAICGAVARAGERHGIPTPINLACWQLVSALAPTPRDNDDRRP